MPPEDNLMKKMPKIVRTLNKKKETGAINVQFIKFHNATVIVDDRNREPDSSV